MGTKRNHYNGSDWDEFTDFARVELGFEFADPVKTTTSIGVRSVGNKYFVM